MILAQANALQIPLADESVHCVITSPPYYKQRDYGLANTGIGMENTPEEYVAMLAVAGREIKRVLKATGVLWLNLDDRYLKKNLLGLPWKVAFALQDDGWILRMDCIWNKTNILPESVTDRPTGSHEYVFLLTKQGQYFYDIDAVREEFAWPAPTDTVSGKYQELSGRDDAGTHMSGGFPSTKPGRNLRSVWTIPTQPTYEGAHFATFPEKLVEPMIKAGCPESGIVLDPFSGSGTTGIVARRLKRDYVGLDLSLDYVRLSRSRLDLDVLEAWNGGDGIPDDSDMSDLPLFKKEST